MHHRLPEGFHIKYDVTLISEFIRFSCIASDVTNIIKNRLHLTLDGLAPNLSLNY